MQKKILNILKKYLGVVKKYWLGILFLILVGVLITAAEFYDFKIMVSKKSSSPAYSQKYTANLQKPSEFNSENQGSPKLTAEDLDVDLENLSEEELLATQAYLKFKKIKTVFTPTGIPEVYGKELNISFDQVQEAINTVAPFDPTYGQKKITLTGQELARYIKIGSQIACEFCCGATTLVFENGEAACGCDHSQMMRGLAAYLIKNHPELSDEQILKELSTWKISYFPKQTLSKKLDELEKAGEPGIKEILEEFPDFLPEMVGGC